MITECKYNLEQIKEISKTMTFIVDSREKQNSHILQYFDKHGFQYVKQALSYGDYSFYLPASGLVKQDMYFHKEIAIERKASLEELSGNLGKERDRFEKEMLKASKDGCKLYLMVESKGGYSDIMEHKYNTQFKPLQYVTSLKSLENRYHLDIQFIDGQYAGYLIYSTFYYFLRERLT